MGNGCLLQHLEDQEEALYTLPLLLAKCTAELRFAPAEYTLSPNGGGGRMDPNSRPSPTDGPVRASGSETGSDRTGADGGTRQLLEQLLKEQGQLSDVVMKQQAQLSALQPSTGGLGVLDDRVHQWPAGNDWNVAARVAAQPPRVAPEAAPPEALLPSSTRTAAILAVQCLETPSRRSTTTSCRGSARLRSRVR